MLTPSKFLPAGCNARRHCIHCLLCAFLCIVGVFMAGASWDAGLYASMSVVLVCAAVWAFLSYRHLIMMAQTLQAYYMWSRSNMR